VLLLSSGSTVQPGASCLAVNAVDNGSCPGTDSWEQASTRRAPLMLPIGGGALRTGTAAQIASCTTSWHWCLCL
jgi:hypothetical protein